jgi:glyoxylase-like metal-dependent hydrolase (beta-lactamase superfamily II)
MAVSIGGVAMLWVGVTSAQTDAAAAVDRSIRAMGAEHVRTMVISGDGFSSVVGQSFDPHSAWWRKLAVHHYVRSIDFEKKGWRIQCVQGEGENPPGGGAGRITPAPDVEINAVSLADPAFDNPLARGQGIDSRAPGFAAEMEYIFLPVGFLRTALEKHATVKTQMLDSKQYTVLTFPIENRAAAGGFKTTVSGWIDDRGLVERVATTIDNIVLGDIVWDVRYSDWKDVSGVKVPMHIVQHQGLPAFFELAVSDVKINAPVDLTVAAAGKAEAAGEGSRETTGGTSENLGNDFWLVPGGYAGVIGNFTDYLVAIEGPQDEPRAEQIIREARRLAPGKPIKYVINTHAHFDHAGGLRAFVAAGATILTHEGNRGYYEQTLANPHTLVPDALSTAKPRPAVHVEYFSDTHTVTDGVHTIQLYRVRGSTHNAFMVMAYLPQSKTLIEADEFNAPAKRLTAPPARINSYEVNLLANVEGLGLDVDRIIPIHPPADGRMVSLAELRFAAGKP